MELTKEDAVILHDAYIKKCQELEQAKRAIREIKRELSILSLRHSVDVWRRKCWRALVIAKGVK